MQILEIRKNVFIIEVKKSKRTSKYLWRLSDESFFDNYSAFTVTRPELAYTFRSKEEAQATLDFLNTKKVEEQLTYGKKDVGHVVKGKIIITGSSNSHGI